MKTIRLAFVFGLLLSSRAAFGEPAAPLADFLGPQGCAIGPPTRAAIETAGYGNEAIDALLAQASTDPQTVRTGEWIVLPPSICRIRPPDVPSEIRLTDPDVQAFTSAMDGYAASGFRGCFFTGLALRQALPFTRGWSEDKAYLEWLRFMAENLRAGSLAFYGTNPEAAPPGFLVLLGNCANIPELGAIRRSQAIRDREFDFFIRANAAEVTCGADRLYSPRAKEIIQAQVGAEDTNQWMVIEMGALATTVGPFLGSGPKQDRRELPPFCHFE